MIQNIVLSSHQIHQPEKHPKLSTILSIDPLCIADIARGGGASQRNCATLSLFYSQSIIHQVIEVSG